MGVEWRNALDSPTRTVIERQALRPFLQRQRWFGSKSREIKQARFTDWSAVRESSNPAFLSIVSLEYSDGRTESYFVPLALVGAEEAERMVNDRPAAVLARITGARKGAIVDAVYDDDTCGRILELIERGAELASARGSVHGLIMGRPLDLNGDRRWGRGTGDQSNSLAFVNDRYVLKLFRRMEPGPNPEYEIGGVLTRRGFTRTPRLAGAIEYLRPNLEPGTLAVLQTMVSHQGTGWEFTVDELRRFYERVSARVSESHGADGPYGGPPPPPPPPRLDVVQEELQTQLAFGASEGERLSARIEKLEIQLASAREDHSNRTPFDAWVVGAILLVTAVAAVLAFRRRRMVPAITDL
jgi:maltose alpha-D-glucosyltransferase/alpha-amylase